MENECMLVQDFMNKMEIAPEHSTQSMLVRRIAYMQEELSELSLAVYKQDIVDVADALIDLVYFAKGTAVLLGLPWEELFAEVHLANMTKQAGRTKRGVDGDADKSMYTEPRVADILLERGVKWD